MVSCELCGRDFKSERGLAAHSVRQHPPEVEGTVFAATEVSIEAAPHLGPMDAGAVEVLRRLARTIDGMDERDSEAPLDNVTIPTYLKYATELGLTSVGRLKLGAKKDAGGSKLAQLRSISGGRAG